MDINLISPYVRRAMCSTMYAPACCAWRVLFDYELIYVQNGGCLLETEDSSYECRQGQVIFIRPGVPHAIFVREQDGVLVQPHIHFDVLYHKYSERNTVSFSPLDQLTEQQKKQIQPDILSDYPIPWVFTPEPGCRFLFLLLRTISRFQQSAMGELTCRADVMELIGWLMKSFPVPRTEHVAPPLPNAEWIQQYIVKNFRKKLDLQQLSDHLYFNKHTLAHQFQKRYGCSIMQYYNQQRIDYAVWRLRNSNVTVTQLAAELGYTEPYNFNHFFKRHTGLSPSEYRKLHGTSA